MAPLAPRRRSSSRLAAPGLLAAATLLGATAFLGLGGAPVRLGRAAARGSLRSRLPCAARGGEEGAKVEVLKVGDVVEAVFPDDEQWYTASVQAVNDDGSFEVKWDDPDGGPEVSTVAAESVKKYVPPIPLDDLVVGQKYSGTIESVAPFGAFVNFGAEANGLVHISAIKDGFVSNIEEEVEVGQQVDVWVKQIRDGKVGLVMVESKLSGGGDRAPREAVDFTPFEALSDADELDGEVVSVMDFGAFVKAKAPGGEEAQGLVHISQISDDGFVDDVHSVVQAGQSVKVRVLSVDRDRNRMSLTMKSL